MSSVATVQKDKTSQIKIAVIIVNYQAGNLVAKHLNQNLAELQSYPDSHIYIVDNASPNGDGQMLTAYVEDQNLSEKVTVLAETDNHGFAKGNNVALRLLEKTGDKPDYIFLLNPDAYLLPDGLSHLVKFMETHPKAGMAGSRLEGEDGKVQISAFRFPDIWNEFAGTVRTGIFQKLLSSKIKAPPQREETYETDWLCGAAVLIRRELFEDIGLFDETYFLYYEETDFMLQSKRAGWQNWYVHKSHAVHLVGQSTGVKDGKVVSKVSPPYVFQSRTHYFRKNHGFIYALLADMSWLAGSGFFGITRRLVGRSDEGVFANMKQFFASRKKQSLSVARPQETGE